MLPRTLPTNLVLKRSILPLKSLIISPVYRYVKNYLNSLIVINVIPNACVALVDKYAMLDLLL